MSVTTRFAPSPTGYLHIGGARTALFSCLFAHKCQGQFKLRIEDTDATRSTAESVQTIFDGLNWLGIPFVKEQDGSVMRQSNRFDRYRAMVEQLALRGEVYPCYTSKEELAAIIKGQEERKEKPRYPHIWRPEPNKVLPPVPKGVMPVWRFKNPLDGQVVVKDLIKGDMLFKNRELDDFVVLRADGTPTYNFCVVVDDMDMGVTHVIRGDDHVNNTPRQMNVMLALGYMPPVYAHVPMIFTEDGKKMSKRDGAASVTDFRDMGFTKEVLLNYLLRLSMTVEHEKILSFAEMPAVFDLTKISPSPARFNRKKLVWFSGEYLKSATFEEIKPELDYHVNKLMTERLPDTEFKSIDEGFLELLFDLQKTRCSTLVELVDKSVPFLAVDITYDEVQVDKHLRSPDYGLSAALGGFRHKLQELKSWTITDIQLAIDTTLVEHGLVLKQLAQPVRVCLMGFAISPPLAETVHLLGKEASIKRLADGMNKIAPKMPNAETHAAMMEAEEIFKARVLRL